MAATEWKWTNGHKRTRLSSDATRALIVWQIYLRWGSQWMDRRYIEAIFVFFFFLSTAAAVTTAAAPTCSEWKKCSSSAARPDVAVQLNQQGKIGKRYLLPKPIAIYSFCNDRGCTHRNRIRSISFLDAAMICFCHCPVRRSFRCPYFSWKFFSFHGRITFNSIVYLFLLKFPLQRRWVRKMYHVIYQSGNSMFIAEWAVSDKIQ